MWIAVLLRASQDCHLRWRSREASKVPFLCLTTVVTLSKLKTVVQMCLRDAILRGYLKALSSGFSPLLRRTTIVASGFRLSPSLLGFELCLSPFTVAVASGFPKRESQLKKQSPNTGLQMKRMNEKKKEKPKQSSRNWGGN
ncbi:hypothetical protein L484_024019 [Morus notabilis]|uniref:Uncharacterized protein n=1 Tax=Morus notabilis TaxID=981085 RepID=W9S0C9_9ROSA|nr:hypothetical protein L484_024019 [Morus notabilis]